MLAYSARRWWRRRAVSAGRTGLLLLLAAFCAQASAASVSTDIGRLLNGAPTTDLVHRLQAYRLLKLIYAARHDEPGWVTPVGPRPVARAMLDAVHASRVNGLNPEDYHLERLKHLVDLNFNPLSASAKHERLAELELLLSDAFLRLAADEDIGRVDPATFKLRSLSIAPASAPARALGAVLGGEPPAYALQNLLPRHGGYPQLRAALSRYRALEAHGGLQRIALGGTLRSGARGPRVAQLIRRLEDTGDLQGGRNVPATYDATVQGAVRRFQARHGLSQDGIVGPATLAVMNEPIDVLIDKIRVNLERIRWLPRERPPTRVVVNIADFRATFYQDGKAILSERAIVGRRFQQTPEFTGAIRYLVTDPAWDVPQSIAEQEILPHAKRDPSYLARHGYEVLSGWGRGMHRVDPARIDWSHLRVGHLPYHFRQAPGPDNPLGRVKFMFPNRYDVYMHDTPARELFVSSRRTFSHGCIRVEHAMRLAAAFLKLNDFPNPGLVLIEAVSHGEPQHIDLPKPVPIYIVYRTVWINDSGMLEFRHDIYGRDAEVLAALNASAAVTP